MKEFFDKIEKKGQFKTELDRIARDVALVLKVRDGVYPPLAKSYVEQMISRYNEGHLRSEKFSMGLVYRSVLEIMANDGRMPDVEKEDLKRFERELLRYPYGAYIY